jgi:hypothetical protein
VPTQPTTTTMQHADGAWAANDEGVARGWSGLLWAPLNRIASMVRGVGLCVYGVGEQHARCLFVLLARVAWAFD